MKQGQEWRSRVQDECPKGGHRVENTKQHPLAFNASKEPVDAASETLPQDMSGPGTGKQPHGSQGPPSQCLLPGRVDGEFGYGREVPGLVALWVRRSATRTSAGESGEGNEGAAAWHTPHGLAAGSPSACRRDRCQGCLTCGNGSVQELPAVVWGIRVEYRLVLQGFLSSPRPSHHLVCGRAMRTG